MGEAELSAKPLGEAFLNLSAVRAFVRQSLGCGCPESVFDHVVVGYPAVFEAVADETAEVQLLVGKRLLISIVDLNGVRPADAFLERALRKGKDLRDRYALNRFRLVLVGEPVEYPLEHWQKRFCKDDRLHLHVLRKSEVLGVLVE
jgi:hypothetical protein